MIIYGNIEASLFEKRMLGPQGVRVRTQVSIFGSPFSASGLGSCQLVSPTPSAGVKPGQQLGMASPVPGQDASWPSEGKGRSSPGGN